MHIQTELHVASFPGTQIKSERSAWDLLFHKALALNADGSWYQVPYSGSSVGRALALADHGSKWDSVIAM